MAAYFICPICGGEVKAGAIVCPHCGADDETGWSDKTSTDEIERYGEEEYGDSLRREFGGPVSMGRRKGRWIAVVAGVLLFLWLLSYL